MRYVLPSILLILLAACGDDGTSTTKSTTLDTSTTSDAPTTGASSSCAKNSDCPDYYLCGQDKTCQPYDCKLDEHFICEPGGFCWGGYCQPKHEIGEPCVDGVDAGLAQGCFSGRCTQVGDVATCVTPCDLTDSYAYPPHQCSPGFLCIGSVKGDWCWPEGSGDYLDVGAPCEEANVSNMLCVTKHCGDDNTCRWTCLPGDYTCPEGLTCDTETYDCV